MFGEGNKTGCGNVEPAVGMGCRTGWPETTRRPIDVSDGSLNFHLMKKPLRCILKFHDWEWKTNDEGQHYKICARCWAFRDFTPAMGAS